MRGALTEKRIAEILKRLDNVEKRLAEMEKIHTTPTAHKNHIAKKVDEWMNKMRLGRVRLP